MTAEAPQTEVTVVTEVPAPTPPTPQTPSTIDTLLQAAVAQNFDVEKLGKLIALKQLVDADIARKAYFEALAAFQGKCPAIIKSKSAKRGNGNAMYSYAPLDAIMEVASPLLAEHGLSFSFKAETTEKTVKVTCIAKHTLGHTEESVMETELATKTDIMSKPQQVAATITFNKRYAFTNAFGIVTKDEDDEDNIPSDAVKQPTTASPKAKASVILQEMGEKPNTPEETRAIIKKLTDLEWSDANAEEIVSRLQIKRDERKQHAGA